MAKNLRSVALSEGTRIAPRAFYGLSRVTAITLPDSVTAIGSNAFARTGLVEFSLPASLLCLEPQVFYRSANLAIIRIRRTTAPIVVLKNDNAFTGTNLRSIFVPTTMHFFEYDSAPSWRNFRDFLRIS